MIWTKRHKRHGGAQTRTDFNVIKNFYSKSEEELQKKDIDFFHELCGPIGRLLLSVYVRAGKKCKYTKEELMQHFRLGMQYYEKELEILLKAINYNKEIENDLRRMEKETD